MSDEGWADLVDRLDAVSQVIVPGVIRGATRAADGLGLSFAHLSTLYVLRHGGPRTVHQVADAAEVSFSTASRLVSHLASLELVDRRERDTDRRVRQVSLTPQGHQLLRSFERNVIAAQFAAFGQLSADERTTVLRAVDLMARARERERAASEG